MPWIDTTTLGDKPEKKVQTLAIDFDGTLVENEFPNIGAPCEGAVEFLKEMTDLGWKLILETLRTDDDLQRAVLYCNQNNIDLWGINENPDQSDWNDAKKVHATLKIDDRNVGIPLKTGSNNKPCVDWAKVRDLFVSWEVLPPKTTDGTKTFQIK